ncbi:MAG: hypothetical protein HOP18_09415 [Deltaproteobacteria bacterium]|nr:hypothetical protein [Deltaproteobacteria bacterium]
MQLKVRRSQRAGMMGKVLFALDVVADLTKEEHACVERYKLWNEVVYSSEAATANAERAQAGNLAALGSMIADKVMKKFLTIKNLTSGEHIECKDLGELLTVEEQVRLACSNLKKYLAIAETFDGREEVIEVDIAA